MIKGLLSLYSFSYIKNVVYMLQSSDYQARPYLKWYWRTSNFNSVAKRRQLDRTPIALFLTALLLAGILAQITTGLAMLFKGDGYVFYGLAILISYPIVWAHLVVVPTILGRFLIINRRNKKLASHTRATLNQHPATIIAVAGSYGKTSMKELLKTVIGEGKEVAITPANKNVITEHAKFARSLSGKEEVVIIELGEEKPGDVRKFADTINPDIALVTGLAPAHLDKYKSVEDAGKDIFSIADNLHASKLYVNGDSEFTKTFIKNEYVVYDRNGIKGDKVSSVKLSLDGTKFELKTQKATYKLHSRLIGRHHIGPICAAIDIAENLGLTKSQIEAGVAKTTPYEHRMEPKQMIGAWILDDTYNGTIEGMKAGLELLKELKAKRKIYVTPGLVDQGKQSDEIHRQLGLYIADSQPDVVVLMRNSATPSIEQGINDGKYKGNVNIQSNPVEFYTNLDKFVAIGDLVLMQNDWTDNYN